MRVANRIVHIPRLCRDGDHLAVSPPPWRNIAGMQRIWERPKALFDEEGEHWVRPTLLLRRPALAPFYRVSMTMFDHVTL